jgi:hypothetical protein
MKYAWIENDHVRDIAPGNPAEFYTPEVAANYTTEIADDIMQGARLVDGNWVNLEVPVGVNPPIRLISANDVRLGLTLAERAKWDNDSTAEIKTAKIEFSVSITSTAATEVLDFLVQTQNISQASADKIIGTTS